MTKKKTAETQPELAAEDNLASEEFNLEKAIKDAKGSFNLGSRIKQSLKPRRASIVIHLDQEALDQKLVSDQAISEIESKLNLAQQAFDNGDADAADMEHAIGVLTEALSRFRADQARVAEALALSELTLHLQSLPDDSMQEARRSALKSSRKLTKEAPDKLEEVFTRQLTARLLKDACVAIFDGAGAVGHLTKLEDAMNLARQLHPSEADRLRRALDLITLNSALVSASTDDPGF